MKTVLILKHFQILFSTSFFLLKIKKNYFKQNLDFYCKFGIWFTWFLFDKISGLYFFNILLYNCTVGGKGMKISANVTCAHYKKFAVPVCCNKNEHII